MVGSYRVFTSAPAIWNIPSSWTTASSHSPSLSTTIDKALHHLSLYTNVIFDPSAEEHDASIDWNDEEDSSVELSSRYPPMSYSHLDISSDSSSYEMSDVSFPSEVESPRSEGTSINHFPVFHFSPNDISSLSSLIRSGSARSKVTLLLGVLEVDDPKLVTIKTGVHSGSEVNLLRLIVGDDNGAICKLVAWRETATALGGIEREPGLLRGDIALFENVLISNFSPSSQNSSDKVCITAAPNLSSKAQLCYRTLPRTRGDGKWRPDLRLADSFPAVRRVADIVRWMECIVGITTRR